MAKRSKRPRASQQYPTTPPARTGRRRDAVTTFARFCGFLSLGLLGVAFFVPFPGDLNVDLRNVPPNVPQPHPPITLDNINGFWQKAAVGSLHTPAAWITLGVVSLLVSLIWFRKRYAVPRSRIVAWAPLLAIALIGIHAGLLQYLKASNDGLLTIEMRQNGGFPDLDFVMGPPPATASMPATAPATATAPSTAPASAQIGPQMGPAIRPRLPSGIIVTSITRRKVIEGASEQWVLLFSGDVLFCAPIWIAWMISLGIAKIKPADATDETKEKS